MPTAVRLPAAALNNMSISAMEQLADNAPHLLPPPPPAVNVVHGTSSDETFYGTAGPDLFIFDASVTQGVDVIIGYDPSLDRIEFRNWDGVSGGSYDDETGSWTLGYQAFPGNTGSQITIDNLGFSELDPWDSISVYLSDGSSGGIL